MEESETERPFKFMHQRAFRFVREAHAVGQLGTRKKWNGRQTRVSLGNAVWRNAAHCFHFALHPHPDLSFIHSQLDPSFFVVRFLAYRLVFFCLAATQIPPLYPFSCGTEVT